MDRREFFRTICSGRNGLVALERRFRRSLAPSRRTRRCASLASAWAARETATPTTPALTAKSSPSATSTANVLDEMGKKYPKAKKYFDYRKMLEDMGDKIDAVTVSTPDHSHAPASVMAMRMGKHCFCQKPLTWSIEEARLMRTLAAEKKLCTQMGNQGTAETGFRAGVELIRSGILGPIKEIHRLDQPPDLAAGHGPAQGDATASPTTSAGMNSWALPTIGRTMLTTSRSNGAAGSTSAPAPWATWPATRSTSPAWLSSSSTPSRSKSSTPRGSSIAKATRSGRSSAPASARATAADPLTMTWFDGGDKFPNDKKTYKEHLQGLEGPRKRLAVDRRERVVLLQERLRRRARPAAQGQVQGRRRSPSQACLARPATSPSG